MNQLKRKLGKLDTDEVEAIGLIVDELIRAREKHPEYPKDLLHQSAIVTEEVGELVRACLHEKYEKGSFQKCIKEAVQTGATAIRFIVQR